VKDPSIDPVIASIIEGFARISTGFTKIHDRIYAIEARLEKLENTKGRKAGARRVAKHRLKVRAMREGLGIKHDVNQAI
jgi:hypothetical protein